MYPVIEITASAPYERGVEYGKKAKKWIDLAVAHYYQRFQNEGYTVTDLERYALDFVACLTGETPIQMEETKGIAAGSGRTLAEIMVVNCRYEISKFPKTPECTTAAILPESTAKKNTFLVKNWDYSTHILPHVVLLHFNTPEFKAWGITEAGQLVRDGFNQYKVGFVNNNLQSVTDNPGIGVPATFLRRRLLEAKSFDEACDLIEKAKRTVSCNMLVADGYGHARDYETYPGGVDAIEETDGLLTHANHFVVDPRKDALTDRPKNRDARLREILLMKKGAITSEYVMTCMRDHKYHPLSICAHPDPGGIAYVRDRITVSSAIMNLTDCEMWFCAGPPCQGDYARYAL
ncbi:MAG: C45 family peptidase [Fusobacteriaceae bacterium]|jgi:isopenicillin-N N-acyltransferase-like protein|nr:C45 family peptidase [Fusobacteriaceae bacterium]